MSVAFHNAGIRTTEIIDPEVYKGGIMKIEGGIHGGSTHFKSDVTVTGPTITTTNNFKPTLSITNTMKNSINTKAFVGIDKSSGAMGLVLLI